MKHQIMAGECHIIGNQGVDTEQLTAYLGQAHGVLLGLLLTAKSQNNPKPHASSTPEPAISPENQAFGAIRNPPEVQ
ncbi:MAG: hypothetical protein GVY36_20190 [Verrucomicrobia bacterium]|nr:hypothetical protein [Verrucomicrobiota bacterium]